MTIPLCRKLSQNKERKPKHFLKNWRPITLLNVDFNIASSCIANRIKPILRNIISETQKGFLKGRYIGECTRLAYDLIAALKSSKTRINK
jgi:hypothetical protein